MNGSSAHDGGAIGVIRGCETAEVGKVFVKRLLPICRKIRKRFVVVILRHEGAGSGFFREAYSALVAG